MTDGSAGRGDDRTVVAFDTSGPFIAVGQKTGDLVTGTRVEMPRGQGEHLLQEIERHLGPGGWATVAALGVGVGPGNFTGVRIAVSAARGLGLALGIPVFGLTAFEIAWGRIAIPEDVWVSLPAPREQVFVQRGTGAGQLIDLGAPPQGLEDLHGGEVFGYRAAEVAAALNAQAGRALPDPTPETLATLTHARLLRGEDFDVKPKPYYIRPADAAPPRDAPPVLID